MHLSDLEINQLLDVARRKYGYDFSGYSRASQKRRIVRFLREHHFADVDEAIQSLLTDPLLFRAFVYDMTVVVTEMFRDPWVYRAIREHVIPWLKTFPFVRIWHAGCATGEEVYAMSILLHEEGLTDRVQIYATDLNDLGLEQARSGIYPAKRMREYTRNYQESGGTGAFSDYYYAKYNGAKMDSTLRKNVTFANHNLVTDSVFGEMHLIMCRNVLIYFDRTLQNRVLRLFKESLCPGGMLCLGTRETLQFSSVENDFEMLGMQERIFRRKIAGRASGGP